MFNRENTEANELKALFEFGAKCYKRGYRQATMDMLAGFGLASMIVFSVGLIEKVMTRGK